MQDKRQSLNIPTMEPSRFDRMTSPPRLHRRTKSFIQAQVHSDFDALIADTDKLAVQDEQELIADIKRKKRKQQQKTVLQSLKSMFAFKKKEKNGSVLSSLEGTLKNQESETTTSSQTTDWK